MRILLQDNYFSTTSFYDETYYINNRINEVPSGPSVVLIVGLTMAFIGATILIVIICCVCRKRPPPDSQGAIYERAATSDGQVTSYPLGTVGTTASSAQPTTFISSQMSTAGPQMPGSYLQQSQHMHGNNPGQQPYPMYVPHPGSMGPPYIYPVPQPTQPMTTLAVFGAPDSSTPVSAAQENIPAPMPYPPMYPNQDTLRSQHMQEYNRQMNMGAQHYNAGPQYTSDMMRQATAPPPPAPL